MSLNDECHIKVIYFIVWTVSAIHEIAVKFNTNIYVLPRKSCVSFTDTSASSKEIGKKQCRRPWDLLDTVLNAPLRQKWCVFQQTGSINDNMLAVRGDGHLWPVTVFVHSLVGVVLMPCTLPYLPVPAFSASLSSQLVVRSNMLQPLVPKLQYFL